MPLDARFLHWQQAPDDELLYTAGEFGVANEHEVSGEGYARALCGEASASWEDATCQDEEYYEL